MGDRNNPGDPSLDGLRCAGAEPWRLRAPALPPNLQLYCWQKDAFLNGCYFPGPRGSAWAGRSPWPARK